MKYFSLVLVALLLLCLAPMPYGYFMLVRFVAMIVFLIMSYHYYENERPALMVVFGALALLFQPFIKITLGRTMWNVVDVVVAIFLVILVFVKKY